MNAIATVGYPEKFELALKYGEGGPLLNDPAISDSDKLLLYALARQAETGPCKEPRPSMWDTVAKAKWNAWKELGNRSKFEAMFMYVQAVEEFAPDWWKWPELGLVPASPSSSPLVVDGADAEEEQATNVADSSAAAPQPQPPRALVFAPPPTAGAAAPPTAAAAAPPAAPEAVPLSDVAPPLQLAPNALAVGGWSALPDEAAPARYRHACAVVGARLFVFGGRSNSGRLATDLFQLNLLTGRWSVPATSGTSPDLRWGHSMSAFRQWFILFGGHRRRGCLNDTMFFDTEGHAWETPRVSARAPATRSRRNERTSAHAHVMCICCIHTCVATTLLTPPAHAAGSHLARPLPPRSRERCRHLAATTRPPLWLIGCGSLAATRPTRACSHRRSGLWRSPLPPNLILQCRGRR